MMRWRQGIYCAAERAWPGGRDKEGSEEDVPENEREATQAELQAAAEKSFEQPGGERGDLGDSGPGED